MNKFLTFFEKSGMIKLIVAFVFMAIFAGLHNITDNKIFGYLFLIPTAYIIVAFILFFGAAFYNTIKDFINRKK